MMTQLGLSVMYQSIRSNYELAQAATPSLTASEFEFQLDWLCENYDVLSPELFLNRLGTGTWPFQKPACLLTFDDGTKDHAEIVTPILQQRGLSAVFFVLSWPAELGKIPLSHAVRWLLGGDEKIVWELFERYARNYLGGARALGDERRAREIYRHESPLRARIKYAAHVELTEKSLQQIVLAGLRQAGTSMGELAGEWFVSADDIRAMHAAGMTIGIHGCSHRSPQAMGPEAIINEIEHSSEYLTKLTGQQPKWFAAPQGAVSASMDTQYAMQLALKKVGVIASVTNEKHMIDRFHCNPMYLPRLTPTDLPMYQPQLMVA